MKAADFIITGPMRSGTTYLSSILNGQENVACLEAYPHGMFRANYEYREQLESEFAIRESEFIHVGLQSPDFSAAQNLEELVGVYSEHIRRELGVYSLGYKRTMLSEQRIREHVAEGAKVIIMRRATESIMRSWVKRIDPSLASAAYTLQKYYKSINYYKEIAVLDGVMVVDYEDLVDNLDGCLDTLSNFLEIKISPDVTRYYSFNKNRRPFTDNSSFHHSERNAGVLGTLPTRYIDEDYISISHEVDNGQYISRKLIIKEVLLRLGRKIIN